jgi:beta-galactosidase GanA
LAAGNKTMEAILMNKHSLRNVLRVAFCVAALMTGGAVRVLHAQSKDQPLPKIVQKDGRYGLFVDGAPYLMLGAQVNNSSAWPAMLPKVWPAIEYLHANTVEMPVYWEQFEPEKGQFDYTVLDTLLAQAREHHVASCAAVVWHVEEWQFALHASVVEAHAGACSAHDRRERTRGGLAIALCHVGAKGRWGGIQRADAPVEDSRRPAHGVDGASGE